MRLERADIKSERLISIKKELIKCFIAASADLRTLRSIKQQEGGQGFRARFLVSFI